MTTTPLSTLYLALFTTANTDASAGTEVPSSNGYARVDTKGKWGAPSGTSPTQVQNNAIITFPTASGAWASGSALVSFALYDASTSGNRLAWGDLTDTSKTVATGDTISFAVAALTITGD